MKPLKFRVSADFMSNGSDHWTLCLTTDTCHMYSWSIKLLHRRNRFCKSCKHWSDRPECAILFPRISWAFLLHRPWDRRDTEKVIFILERGRSRSVKEALWCDISFLHPSRTLSLPSSSLFSRNKMSAVGIWQDVEALFMSRRPFDRIWRDINTVLAAY